MLAIEGEKHYNIRLNCNNLMNVTYFSDKLTIEPDSNTDSSAAVFSESGSGGAEAGASGAAGWSSIRRHHHSGRSLVSSRRGSVGSRGTARGDSCSSSDGASGYILYRIHLECLCYNEKMI